MIYVCVLAKVSSLLEFFNLIRGISREDKEFGREPLVQSLVRGTSTARALSTHNYVKLEASIYKLYHSRRTISALAVCNILDHVLR